MAEISGISWTDATFNPWWGCAKVSPACDHCYAERDAARFAAGQVLWGVDAQRREFGDKHWNEPVRWNKKAEREGKRLRVFCASMADVFDKNAPAGARDRLWRLIVETPQLDWLLLTKRIGNVERMVPPEWVARGPGQEIPRWPANAWIGATVVDQLEADRDVPKLLRLPAPVRFLSMEPLLGPVDLRWALSRKKMNLLAGYLRRGLDAPARDELRPLDWVIVGGESGRQARPLHPAWARQLANDCEAARVPFHFKQWGEYSTHEIDRTGSVRPYMPMQLTGLKQYDEQLEAFLFPQPNAMAGAVFKPGAVLALPVGTKQAGRELDGAERNGFPTTTTTDKAYV